MLGKPTVHRKVPSLRENPALSATISSAQNACMRRSGFHVDRGPQTISLYDEGRVNVQTPIPAGGMSICQSVTRHIAVTFLRC